MRFGVLLMTAWKSSRLTAVGGSTPHGCRKSRVAALALPLALAAVVSTADAQPAGAAASEAKWDRRDFNGIWQLAGSSLDTAGASGPIAGAPERELDLADDWGFDTRPQLKGKYLQDYRQRKQADKQAGRDFMVTCQPNGMPALTAGPYANEILQNAKQLNWFQEFPGETWRIYLDGRPHPNPEEVAATLTGHSTGKWDGNTLVVETVHIRTDTLLFGQGRSAKSLGHSDKMRIVTRFHRVDAEHLQVKGTVEDPEALVTPWQYTLTYRRQPGEEIVEYLCEDNNQEKLDPVTGREITEIPPQRNQPNSPPK
jgi:hypothetical protein